MDTPTPTSLDPRFRGPLPHMGWGGSIDLVTYAVMRYYGRFGIVTLSRRAARGYYASAPTRNTGATRDADLTLAIKIILIALGAPVAFLGVLVAIGTAIKEPPAPDPVIPPPTREQVRAQILHRQAIHGDRRWYENDIIDTVDDSLYLGPGPDSECLRSDEAGNVSEVSYSLCEAAITAGKQRLSLD